MVHTLIPTHLHAFSQPTVPAPAVWMTFTLNLSSLWLIGVKAYQCTKNLSPLRCMCVCKCDQAGSICIIPYAWLQCVLVYVSLESRELRQVKCFKASLQWNPVNSEESLGLHYSPKTIQIILLKWSRTHLFSFWEPEPNQCLCFCLFCADWNNALDKKVFIGHI